MRLKILLLLFVGNVAFRNTQLNAASLAPPDSLPPIPEILAKKLMDSCTVIDFTFLTLPFTISFDEPKSVQSSFRNLQFDGVQPDSTCKIFAKVFYQVQGRIVLVGDLYFSERCKYFAFSENGERKYGNKLSQEGIDFFTQIINRKKK